MQENGFGLEFQEVKGRAKHFTHPSPRSLILIKPIHVLLMPDYKNPLFL